MLLFILIALLSCHGVLSNSNPFQWSSQGGNIFNDRHVGQGFVNVNSLDLSETPTFEFIVNASTSATPALNSRFIIFPSYDGSIHCYNKMTGALIWEKFIGPDYYGEDLFFLGKHIHSRTTPVFYKGTVIMMGVYGPADVLMINVLDGSLIHKWRLDDHPWALITMSGQVHKNLYMVGVSSLEEAAPVFNPAYTCCNFTGTFQGINLQTKIIEWVSNLVDPSYVLPNPDVYPGPDGIGTFDHWSGVAMWGSSGAIDVGTNLIYIATGNAYTTPHEWDECALATSEALRDENCTVPYYPNIWHEAILGIDMDTGEIKVGHRITAGRAWNLACSVFGSGSPNCPQVPGRDSDFGMCPVLDYISTCDCSGRAYNKKYDDYGAASIDQVGVCRDQVTGKMRKEICDKKHKSFRRQPVLWIGQKSGIAYCLNGTDLSVIWSTAVGPTGLLGGMNWGVSKDSRRLYVSMAGTAQLPWTLLNGTVVYAGGWAALELLTGEMLWTTANPANFDPTGPPGDINSNGRSTTAMSFGPTTSIPGGVLATSIDYLHDPNLGYFGLELEVAEGEPTQFINWGSNPGIFGHDGWVYLLDETDGEIVSSYATGASVYGGFSVDDRCAWVGSGYSFKGLLGLEGTSVFGWCVREKGAPHFSEKRRLDDGLHETTTQRSNTDTEESPYKSNTKSKHVPKSI